tara:strand:- start:276 stop:965 length:690 start_codon:yes stop_codon:yes gene_type:complete
MATGFASVQRNAVNKNPGYKTLFEKITEQTGGEKQTVTWYRNALQQATNGYRKDTRKFVSDEKADKVQTAEQQDGNILRRYTVPGHLYMFSYEAKMRWLPYYDKNPLVYVTKANRNEFWGANLHYLPPKRRFLIVKALLNGQINIPKVCFHKYLHNHVKNAYLLDLHANEWDTAILLPIEKFVKNVDGHEFPFDKDYVWEKSMDSFYDRIKARRVIGTYGRQSDRTMAQ